MLLTIASAQSVIDIQVKKTTATVNPDMYGIFFEDINYGADGGLYAELVKNRSFEFPDHLMGWKTIGEVSIVRTSPFDRNPHALRMLGAAGLENEGFFGMGFRAGESYRFSVWARALEGKTANLQVGLNGLGCADCQAQLTIDSPEWKKYTVVLSAPNTAKGTLSLLLSGGAVEIDHVSLFPVNTFNGHENGLRRDLAEALRDLHPGVFRFPGGCIIEGNTLQTRYQWKNSVGPVENRPLNENKWRDAMEGRFSPDYYQSYGLGFYEYFLLAEEIGAAPLPVLNCGMACEFVNDITKEGDWLVPLAELQPYIDDALDLIEFANGDPAKNKWAALRAEMGHPAPFNLKYLAIGNEQWGEHVAPRLKLFAEQIRKKYPYIQMVGTAGASPEGEEFDRMWREMRTLKVDLVDEHFYCTPEWCLNAATRYDKFPRKGPKVFAGEYACHAFGLFKSENGFASALCEAAIMTGYERNADVVRLATYAPLFAHVEGWQWRPDLIWFDAHNTYRTASYYVQQLFACNKGTHVLLTQMAGAPAAGQNGIYATAVLDKPTGEVIVKIVNVARSEANITLNLHGLKGTRNATITTLQSDDDKADNIGHEEQVSPLITEQTLSLPAASLCLAPRSFTVIRLKK